MPGHEETKQKTSTPESLQDRALRLVLASQVFFFGAITWCVILVHDHAAQNDGISYYAVHHRTLVIAAVGYLAAAIGLWRTSTLFRLGGLDPLIWFGLRVVAVVLVLLLVTPYSGGAFLNWSHMTVGVIGALVQLAISITLWRRYGSLSALLGFSIQLAGGVLGALSLPDWRFEYLLNSEIIFQLGFCWCLIGWTRILPKALSS
jgi:type III secretory pathway component EscS